MAKQDGMQNESNVRAPAMSFIVRVWRDGDSAPSMRGEVENIGTGEKRLFLDYWSLLNLLDSWRQDAELVG
jgi:hypothetical protein